ncbi:MAG: Tol-Pal system beta propeller repeat protein TolB [Alphaproteobacteria bacterium]|jgi:TolB protein|nr:Tol-Pal system beta propeller repeat protein TolB [Alphaproteobacteria bacterium]
MRKLLYTIALIISFSAIAKAELYIDITKGKTDPLPIALTEFDVNTPFEKEIGKKVFKVIYDDLERCGLFKLINKRAFLQSPSEMQTKKPRFEDWKLINASGLITGNVKSEKEGDSVKISFRLWDVLSEEQLIGMSYKTSNENWRRIAHIIADKIYEKLTGEEGYFDTRIVYVSEDGSFKKRIKRLAIMDADGENHRYITDGRNLVLTPRFNSAASEIVYMAYIGKTPRVYIQNIDTGEKRVLGDFPGMTFSPRFSPDGKEVVMSYENKGNSEIYKVNLKTGDKKRLTYDLAIDTSPCFSPDGKSIVFESDRGGSQQLYIMDKNGKNVKRLTYGRGVYGNPVWSPRGDLIAFTRMMGKKFYIGVIKPDGSGERMIVNDFHVEGPSWSPNGRVVIFFKEVVKGRERKASIHSIDLTGYNERVIKTPKGASDPTWSGNL